jgi:tellurite methyltransferase
MDAVRGQPPRETLLGAILRFEREAAADVVARDDAPLKSVSADSERLLAVDLGAGEGRDAAALIVRGWRVIAIDAHPDSERRIRERVRTEAADVDASGVDVMRDRLSVVCESFIDTAWPRCDLVNASFAIPHCRREDFAGLWARISASIRVGGRFAGQFFGVNDQWARTDDGIARTFHTRLEVEQMLAGFEIELLDEVERMGKNAHGEPKYWHVFHVVARKR